ncbi:MAG: M15 family metallopeptidase [Gammaproteobacteria bacterium]
MQTQNPGLIDVTRLSKKLCQTSIDCKLAYATQQNFLGRIVDGYHPDAAHICLMASSAAHALCAVQNSLSELQLGLFVFDSYRPLRAVRDFGRWMHLAVHDDHELVRKEIHYPHIGKNQLAQMGYVCDHVSDHCYGDTIDLTLIDLKNKTLLDMGACFDFFDELSHSTATVEMIGVDALKHRQILSNAMQAVGFIPYEKEYWHFTFREREIEVPIDIAITAELGESSWPS